MAKMVIVIPIDAESTEGAAKFLVRVRHALCDENVLGDESAMKVFLARMTWRVEAELERETVLA